MKNFLQKIAGTMFLLLLLNYANAQIVGTNAFMKGAYLELGVGPDGVYVSDVNAPAGYHDPFFLPNFGMIIDDAKDGWATGTPAFCGDYFAPGSPVEGFAVQVGTNVYSNDPSSSPDAPGTFTSYTVMGSGKTLVWQGNIAVENLHIKQITTLKNNKRLVQTQIMLTNTGATTLSGVYYSRSTDPDNEAPFTGDYLTNNLVLYNHPIDDWAMVTAEGSTYGCLLALGSMQTNARVAYGGFNISSLIPKDAYNGVSPHVISGSTLSDEAITLTFKVGNINPGQTKVLNFVYGSDVDEIIEALGFTNDAIGARQEMEINGYSENIPVISLSPVPSNGLLNVIATGVNPEAQVNVEIINMLGQVVYTQQVENNNGTVMHEVSFDANIPNGTYIMNVIADGAVYSESFILNK